MITHITVEDAAKLISRLTNANETQALTYIREAADRGEIHAADALEELQAENAEMQKQLNEFSEFLCHITGGLLSKTNYTAQVMISAAEDYQQKGCGECDLRAENIRWGQVASEQDKAVDRLQTENEKLRAELEQAKAERDAAIEDIDSILAKAELI